MITSRGSIFLAGLLRARAGLSYIRCDSGFRTFSSDGKIPPCSSASDTEEPPKLEELRPDKLVKRQIFNLTFRHNQPAKVMYFVCNVCKATNLKTFSLHAYEKGVVIVRCDSCRSHHLVADNIGWYDSQNPPGKIEDFIKSQSVDTNFKDGSRGN